MGNRRRGGESGAEQLPLWKFIEGRYKGNLNGENVQGAGGDVSAYAGAAHRGVSSPSSFEELSKARLKVNHTV